jgi:hypothetical protein
MARLHRRQGEQLALALALLASLSLLHNHNITVMRIQRICAKETHTFQLSFTLLTPLSMPCQMQQVYCIEALTRQEH